MLNWCTLALVKRGYLVISYTSNTVFTGSHYDTWTVRDFQEKILGSAGPQVFIFCCQNKYSGRQKLYLRFNGFSFVKDNGLSLVYVFPKKRVTLGARLATMHENLVATE